MLYDSGKVCDEKFNDDAASAICREMGYLTFNTWSTGEKWPIQRSYSISYNEMRCWGPDGISSCSPVKPYIKDSCMRPHDVFLSCTSCPPGSQRKREEGDSDTCAQCPAGTYKSPDGIEEYCTDCPGYSTSKPGSSYCTCPTNSISSSDNMICICPEGKSWVWNGLGVGSCKNGISPFAWFSVVLIIVIVILALLICLLVYERIKRGKEESFSSEDRGSVYAAKGEGKTSKVKTQED